MGIGTLYDYFSCKEAVILAYLEHQLGTALNEVMDYARDEYGDEEDLLKSFVGVGIDFAYAEREILKIVLSHFPDKLPIVNLQDSYDLVKKVSTVFARRSTKKITKRDPEFALFFITNIVVGFQFRITMLPNDDFDRAEVIDELTKVLSAYIYDA